MPKLKTGNICDICGLHLSVEATFLDHLKIGHGNQHTLLLSLKKEFIFFFCTGLFGGIRSSLPPIPRSMMGLSGPHRSPLVMSLPIWHDNGPVGMKTATPKRKCYLVVPCHTIFLICWFWFCLFPDQSGMLQKSTLNTQFCMNLVLEKAPIVQILFQKHIFD